MMWYDDGQYWGRIKRPIVWTLPWKGKKKKVGEGDTCEFFLCWQLCILMLSVQDNALSLSVRRHIKENLSFIGNSLSTIVNLWFIFVFLLLLFFIILLRDALWLSSNAVMLEWLGFFYVFLYWRKISTKRRSLRLIIKVAWVVVFPAWCFGCKNYLLETCPDVYGFYIIRFRIDVNIVSSLHSFLTHVITSTPFICMYQFDSVLVLFKVKGNLFLCLTVLLVENEYGERLGKEVLFRLLHYTKAFPQTQVVNVPPLE